MANGISITLTRVQFADGAFDSETRYIRTVADPINRMMSAARGSTFDLAKFTSGVNTSSSWAFISGASNVVRNLSGPAPTNFNTGLDIAL